MIDENTIDHDTWAYGLPKTRSAGKIELGPIHGVLPFTGVRNPISVSSTSQKVMLPYKTEANNWMPRVGAAESAAEAAVAEEALISPDIYDVEFQPVEFAYQYPAGRKRKHTIDLRLTFRNGLRRFVFVRNRTSLRKPETQEEIEAIWLATPPSEAHEFAVVEADTYSRPRRENLRRMHRAVCFEPDPIADHIVTDALWGISALWRMSDISKVVDLSRARIFDACLRLLANGQLGANLDNVICHHSRVWKASA
ncbi:hypothetical protein [Litoreibacter roseus]|uniref:TnsA endonuclease N terminal n=1 Tax=Litoreibacter roseus TaxID=2601869 RepID=A0A6N6JME6_9RHOB|nr:hypothetical protein [Litoreibacter roseus]GFE67324.1 hypothetical protein KIN_43980 [Litoreibacter roseus]